MDSRSRPKHDESWREDQFETAALILSSLDYLDQGITVFDRDLRLVLANDKFLELRDIPERLGKIGTTFEEQVRFRAKRGDYGPGDPEKFVAKHVELARRFEPHCIERTRRDGTVLEIRGNPLPGGGFIATYTDITERRRAEEARDDTELRLEQRNNQLETAKNHYEVQASELAAMAEDLALSRQEAEAVSRAKSEFLATMSHELRTPLNAVLGFSQIMRDQMLGPMGNDEYLSYAESIFQSGEHLLELINDILDLSRVESGRATVDEHIIDVHELLRAVIPLVEHRSYGEGVALSVECPDTLPPLRADQRKMKQILVNLLSNALKFTETGGKVQLKVWCRPESGFVFQVVDTGIGMSLDDIPKALSTFGQVDGRLSRKYPGTGLGLPLSKSLVELHSGSLDLQSELGVGTTVTVRMPAERVVSDDLAAGAKDVFAA